MPRPFRMGRRRAFSLTEILVVVAILLVLAALLFPAFARSKGRAKLTNCQSRLHQVALGMQMYRADHDGQAWLEYSGPTGGSTTAGRYRYPWNDWLALEPYLKDGRLVWCPIPNRDDDPVTIHNLDHPRMIAKPQRPREGTTTVRQFFEPEPGTVVAYCANHTTAELERLGPGHPEYYGLYKGTYPVVREDGSASLAKSAQIGIWFLWSDGTWHPEEAPNHASSIAWRFPGEPWPPSLPPL